MPAPETVPPLLPTPEAMMVHTWFAGINDVAAEFAEELVTTHGMPEKVRDSLTRKFNGQSYRWNISNTIFVEERDHVDATVGLIFNPVSLVKGNEAFIGGYSLATMNVPDTVKPLSAGGPVQFGLKTRLDLSLRRRTQVLDQISGFLPRAWGEINDIARQLPERQKARRWATTH